MNKLVTLLLIVFVCFAFCQVQANAFEDQEDGENSSGSGIQEPRISQEEEMPSMTKKKPTENQDPEDSQTQEKPAMKEKKPKTKEVKPKESEEPEITQEEEEPAMKKDSNEIKDKPEKTTTKEKKPKEMETEDEAKEEKNPKKSSQDEEKPAQEAPKLTKKQYIKIMRCIFNCSSRYNWSTTLEMFPKCGEKLDCYQDSFDKALKVLKPCIYKCMTSPFDQFN
jgi:outer membrane biosynthesis protein TonB